MKNKSKFICRLSAMLVAVLCVCMLCVPAFASDGNEELLNYGNFEQKDYREIWSGEFASKFPYVIVSSNGTMRFSNFSTFVSSTINDGGFSCRSKTGSGYVVNLGSQSWSAGHPMGTFWSNVPIYDLQGNLIYTPTPVGEVDSETGLLDYGEFYANDYREILVGTLAEKFPNIVVDSHNYIYLYSDKVETYKAGDNYLFSLANYFLPIHYYDFYPKTEWANFNLLDSSGNVVYRTYPVPGMFSLISDYSGSLRTQLSATSVIEVLAYIVGAVVLGVFLWWGVRKAVKGIKSAYLRGKLRF